MMMHLSKIRRHRCCFCGVPEQEIVREADAAQCLLRIAAPQGLLQLGRQKAALTFLEPLLRVPLPAHPAPRCSPCTLLGGLAAAPA